MFTSVYNMAFTFQVMYDSHDSSLKGEGNHRHKRGQDIPDTSVMVCAI